MTKDLWNSTMGRKEETKITIASQEIYWRNWLRTSRATLNCKMSTLRRYSSWVRSTVRKICITTKTCLILWLLCSTLIIEWTMLGSYFSIGEKHPFMCNSSVMLSFNSNNSSSSNNRNLLNSNNRLFHSKINNSKTNHHPLKNQSKQYLRYK
jgi:hypothetical protein